MQYRVLERSDLSLCSLLLLHFYSRYWFNLCLFRLLIHLLTVTTILSMYLNPGLDTRPSTTDCSMMGNTLLGRRGLSLSMTSWRMPSSLFTSRLRLQSTSPKWPRTLSMSISDTPHCSRTRWCTGWAVDAQNHAGSPSRGMKGWDKCLTHFTGSTKCTFLGAEGSVMNGEPVCQLQNHS